MKVFILVQSIFYLMVAFVTWNLKWFLLGDAPIGARVGILLLWLGMNSFLFCEVLNEE